MTRAPATVLALLSLAGCAYTRSAPRQSSVVVVPSVPEDEHCQPSTPAEETADSLLSSLVSEEAHVAQFAFDTLLTMHGDALPFLVCHLSSSRRLATPEMFMVLNRAPDRFESYAHYRPDTVGQTLALILDSPPGSVVPCRGNLVQAELLRCQQAWLAEITAPR